VTTPGTTYPAPITFNIYNTGSVGQVGSLIATDTQTFAVPYRPSASSSCSNGEWLASDGCQYGLATNITFNFSSQHVTLPTEVVYGIAYNSTHNGYAPLSGSGSPMDSLNIAFSDDATNISAGTDADSGTLFMAQSATYTATSQIACVGPFTAGRFQQYSTTCNVLSPPQNNIPAVQFNAAGSGVGDLYPGGASQPINFTVTNPGGSDGQISSVTIAVSSISQTPAGLLLGVCNPLWFGITQPTSPVNVTIPPGGTLTYDPSGASIALGESHTDQDMCQGATVNLSFTSN